ncbi:hypothetical protein O7610_05470 [Solwaraspora sp. WMMA2065]|nr:hypothetical protein [Solwaraspora sp. WMMA2065]WJK35816.1 hypothetical protein O7610_05470 [Solwaraspora sp. WMMA2065]
MRHRIVPLLLTSMLLAAGVAALADRPAVGTSGRSADYVVIVGVPGLRWDDVDRRTTPTLWRLAEQGSIAALAVRSAQRPTCPADGWVTLGAGNYAAYDGITGTTGDGTCPLAQIAVEQPDGIGGYLTSQPATVRLNQERLTWGAVPGALAESVRCTVAIGPGAALTAARPFGRVDRYEPQLPPDPADLLASCVLSVVDAGVVAGSDPTERAAAARRADETLARVLAARPQRSLVLVAGLADTGAPTRLHVAVADGPGWETGWMTSPTTGRDGYLQLVDLAPTALHVLDRDQPDGLFIGQPASSAPGRPEDLATAIAYPADADREARAQRRAAVWFFGLLAGFHTALAVAVVPLLRRVRRTAGRPGPDPVTRRANAVMEVLLIAAALAIPAALLAEVVPWWRSGRPGPALAVATVLVVAAATAAVRISRSYRRTLAPMTLVATIAAAVVAADVLTGARLQLNGVAGYSASEGGRYAGLGTVGLGVLIAGTLLAAGCLAQRVRRGCRVTVVVTIGGAAVILVGSPYLGADPVGAIALTAGVAVTAAISTGGWLSVPRVAWATVASLLVTAGFALLDLQRPETERGSLGRFLTALADGTGGLTLHRSSAANMSALLSSPLTVLTLVAAVLVWFALLQPWGGLKRLFGIYPAVRAAMAGIAVSSVIGGGLAGSALDVAGAAAAVTVPLAALVALRVLGHSADRTRPSTGQTGPPGPAEQSPAKAPDEVSGSAVSAGVTVESRGSRQQLHQ